VLGTLCYKGVKFERGENWSHKTQFFLFFLSTLYLALLNSLTKNAIHRLKILGGISPPSPLPQVTRIVVTINKVKPGYRVVIS
jgi:hypothetical protein